MLAQANIYLPVIINLIVLRTRLWLFFAIALAILSTAVILLSYNYNSQSSARAQDGTNDFPDRNIVGGHTPGYNILETSGDVLDPISLNVTIKDAVVDPMKYLREFNYGKVSELPDGTTLREFTLVASDDKVKEISPGVFYNVWMFNGTVPGPTIRATEGDLVRINFINNGSKSHTVHTHGIHEAEMDGVFETIGAGGRFTYEFTAEPFGVFPYHCHMQPLEEHITHGLYGVYIVDPKTPRPAADEMVMVMNGYDTDFDTENNFYTVNGIPYYYMHHPIQIEKDRLIRIYLVNILEFDPINNFHLHANLYQLYRSGTSLVPHEYTDMVTMSQGERGILEFKYKFPGQYMFHAHKTEFAEKGWMGLFLVKDMTSSNGGQLYNSTSIANNTAATVFSQGQPLTQKSGDDI
ncbi:MAG TPA: multicopper oxidase domain-containing protein [Nitrososphaeraceae archaeon]|nr:multicopper oxidase domain-containing protein [Nitrososphaeraceae archaeon]